MSKDTDKSLFIVSSMPRLYQQVLSGVASYEALGNRIIKRIRTAHAFRDLQQVCELAAMLQNFPIKEYQLIGSYYIVWCKCRQREYDIKALETIIDQSDTYKAKALLSRAAFEGYKGNTTAELFFYNEALKAFPTISERIDILRAIAVVKAKEGFRKSAIRDLESLIPIIRHADALVYFDVLNSYAVELAGAGRKYEARNISQIVISSPFAFAYPEWQETASDLKEPNRSLVIIGPSKFVPNNVLPMPASEHGETEQTSYNQPAKVFNLQRLRKKMAKGKKSKKDKKDNGENIFDENVDEMDDKDLLATLIQLAASDDADEEKLRKIVKYVMKVMSEPYKPEPDDTEGA